MADLIAGHRWKVAISKQSAEGTPATTYDFIIPAYAVGLTPQETRTPYEVADGNAYRPGVYKSKAWGEGTIDFAAFPTSLPRLLTAHLGSDVKTGAGDPWTHTMTSNNTPQWLTIWVNRPLAGASNEWDQYTDCLIKSVEYQGAAGTLPKVSCVVLAKKATVMATAPAATASPLGVTDVLDSVGPWYSPFNGTLKLDLDATPAVTAITTLESYALHFGYDNAEFVQTSALTPTFRDIGLWGFAFSATVVLQDWQPFYSTFFGAKAPAANTDQSPVVVRGALDFTIAVGPTVNANRTADFQLPSLDFQAVAPGADLSGKGLRLTMSGALEKPAAGQPATVILLNGINAAM